MDQEKRQKFLDDRVLPDQSKEIMVDECKYKIDIDNSSQSFGMDLLKSQLSKGNNRDNFEEINSSLLQSMDEVHQTQISTADS